MAQLNDSRVRQVDLAISRYGSCPDPDQVLRLVSQIGYIFLAGPDGCNCGTFSLCCIDVSVSCRKASSEISVTTRSGENCAVAELRPIAIEILRQIFEPYGDLEQKRELAEKFTVKINGDVDSSGVNLAAQLIRYEQELQSRCAPSLPPGVASYSNDAEAIARYGKLTQEAAKSDGSCGVSAGPVICPHGEVEVYCRECDLKARVALHDAVALAVMEERDRCARIASGCICQDVHGKDECGCGWIESKIRSGE